MPHRGIVGGFPIKVASQLAVALHEMMANALTHAVSPIPVLVGFHVKPGLSLSCVVDVGIGVFRSLTPPSEVSRGR